ncbi:thiolase domain-containing protein [Alcaligenaceae bacterium]|nr:thiolase domain-containing protein [Alcaligenaceae bacterium]
MKQTACIAGIYEHPMRVIADRSTAEVHMECARGALRDAGLSFSDVDGFFGGRDIPGSNASWLIDYMNLKLRHVDTTDAGGCSNLMHVSHAAQAIAMKKCSVALITQAGRPRSEGQATGTVPRPGDPDRPDMPWDGAYNPVITTLYGMMAQRHAYEYGTTAEQLAWIRVAASRHAQHNPHAMYPKPVTLEDVLRSPIVADPLRRLDCCVISDGGGALVMVSPEIAKTLDKPMVRVLGCGETIYTQNGGKPDLTTSGASRSGAIAFQEAGINVNNIKYASIYDNFTIMVLIQIEDLGFCKKGEGGKFVENGNLISGQGSLPINTDGGGLCNNHPSNRGGMIKIMEAVRQLRGEAHSAVQVPDCDIALACGPGGSVGSGHGHATVILERV